jgi:hypothetical protein
MDAAVQNNHTGSAVLINGGTFNLNGCKINGTGHSPAVTVMSGGTFNMSSGYVSGFGAAASDNTSGGTVIHTGGDIMSDVTPAVNGPVLGG